MRAVRERRSSTDAGVPTPTWAQRIRLSRELLNSAELPMVGTAVRSPTHPVRPSFFAARLTTSLQSPHRTAVHIHRL